MWSYTVLYGNSAVYLGTADDCHQPGRKHQMATVQFVGIHWFSSIANRCIWQCNHMNTLPCSKNCYKGFNFPIFFEKGLSPGWYDAVDVITIFVLLEGTQVPSDVSKRISCLLYIIVHYPVGHPACPRISTPALQGYHPQDRPLPEKQPRTGSLNNHWAAQRVSHSLWTHFMHMGPSLGSQLYLVTLINVWNYFKTRLAIWFLKSRKIKKRLA